MMSPRAKQTKKTIENGMSERAAFEHLLQACLRELALGDKTDEFPKGYGYCQCGCGRKTTKLRTGRYAYYVGGHHPLAVERKQKNKSWDQPRRIPVRRTLMPGAPKVEITESTLMDLYVKQGKSMAEVAQLCGCSDGTIRQWLARYGIPSRTQSQARISALKKGKFAQFEYYEINEAFFSRWSPEMAWVLGLLYTDGHVNAKQRRLRLSLVDEETLRKVKVLLGYTGPVKTRHQSYDKTKVIFALEFGRGRMFDDLVRLGLTPTKRLTMQFLPDIPHDCMRHLIRGCWDGDGGYAAYGAHYTCGSRAFIEQIVEELYNVGIGRTTLRGTLKERQWLLSTFPKGDYPLKVHERKSAKAFDIRISGRQNLERLFHYFYDDLDKYIFMVRKYAKLEKMLRGKL
jgi:hypothetical protein